jgi:GNAT superfamily N-acetyltransferase
VTPRHPGPSADPGGEVVVTTGPGEPVAIGPLRPDELGDLFAVFADVVATGDGFPQVPPLTDSDFEAAWVRPPAVVVAGRSAGQLIGAYYLRPNFPGRAAHIANAGYVVARSRRRGGVGHLLVEDSLRRAPRLGFDAIQFNLVFAANPARRLYEELGWRQIGRIPDAVEGSDALIYWRRVG